MDLAFVSNVVYPFVTGGAQKRIHEIGTRLATQGHDVTVYGRHFWDGPEVMRYEGLTLRAVAPGVDLYTDDRRSITEAIDFAARLALPLNRQLRSGEHDLIVASVFPYFPVFSATLARLTTETPLVTTWHEVWREYWDDYLGRLAPCGKLVERLTARVPQYPIAVSKNTADRLSNLGVNGTSIEVVPNGIDIDRILSAPLPSESGQESYDLLFAGRLIADKNVSVLLDAFDEVADRHEVTLGIIGDGPEADRLHRQAASLTHGDRVSFLGFLEEYEAVLGHMRAADIFVSPSTREGFGITFVEAMAAGCTVIAADHADSAASEVIGDGGFTTTAAVQPLAAMLERALTGERPPTDPLERATLYDWDNIASKAESAYERAAVGQW